MSETEFKNLNSLTKSNNYVGCDSYLYQFLEQTIGLYEYYFDDCNYNEEILLSINNLEQLKTLNVPKSYFYYACKFNNLDVIKWFISIFKDLDMDSALEIASIHNNPTIMNFLLKNNKNINKRRAIVMAILNNSYEALKILIKYNTRPNTICFDLACENGNKDIVKCLIKHGVYIHSSDITEDYKKDSGFNLACKNAHFEIVSLLMKTGVNINGTFRNVDINAGLKYACQGGNLEMVKYLMSKKAYISESLEYACLSNNFELVEYLIDKGVKINSESIKNTKNIDIIKFLLQKGAEPTPEIIYSAFSFNQKEKAKLLIENYKGDDSFDSTMRNLIFKHRYEDLKYLLENIKINCKDVYEHILNNKEHYRINYENKIMILLKSHC